MDFEYHCAGNLILRLQHMLYHQVFLDLLCIPCTPIIILGLWRYNLIYKMLLKKDDMEMSNTNLLNHTKETIYELPWLVCLFFTAALGPQRLYRMLYHPDAVNKN